MKLLLRGLVIAAAIYLLVVLSVICYNLIENNRQQEMRNEILSKVSAETVAVAPSYEGTFRVPFYFDFLDLPPSSREEPIQVGNIIGEGVINALAFHAGYYGIAVGYSVDGGEIFWINNGHCLIEWRANSENAKDMPVRLLTYENDYDLSIAVNTPIEFKESFKLYFCNSHPETPYAIRSLHLYGYFKEATFGDDNVLRF